MIFKPVFTGFLHFTHHYCDKTKIHFAACEKSEENPFMFLEHGMRWSASAMCE